MTPAVLAVDGDELVILIETKNNFLTKEFKEVGRIKLDKKEKL